MRILLTGVSGQVGWELNRSLSLFGDITCPSSQELDLARPSVAQQQVLDSGAQLVVNCAAYTAVDTAEKEPEKADAVNHRSAAALASACKQSGATLVHFSTDYVFGDMGDAPMPENHPASPLGVYARTKLSGEQAITGSGCPHFIFRTSWVYASRGKNFLLTMLRLANNGQALRIVNDQWGAPTPARVIADCATHCMVRAGLIGNLPNRMGELQGTYNLATSGYTTWHGFAAEIFRLREQLIGEPGPSLEAISTEQFPTPARRQANSRMQLDHIHQTFGLRLPDWQQALAPVVAEALAARTAAGAGN